MHGELHQVLGALKAARKIWNTALSAEELERAFPDLNSPALLKGLDMRTYPASAFAETLNDLGFVDVVVRNKETLYWFNGKK
jgi:TRAP-type C4-dicarboxylate transport system substrate-binding protein